MKSSRVTLAALTLGLMLAAGATGFAAPNVIGSAPYAVVLGITEGPDPIPSVMWGPSSSIIHQGMPRDDGRPDITYHDGAPLVVWAYDTLMDHDVAFSRWTGAEWQETSFLTSTLGVESDPRVFADTDGTVHIVWWVSSLGAVFHLVGADDRWGVPEHLTENAERPSVAVWNDLLHVAVERPAGPQGRTIDLLTRAADGTSSEQTLFEIPRRDPLDAVLHAEAGSVWLDWKQSGFELGYSVLGEAGWSTPAFVPWIDSSWLGELDARAAIRQIVLEP